MKKIRIVFKNKSVITTKAKLDKVKESALMKTLNNKSIEFIKIGGKVIPIDLIMYMDISN